MLYYQCDINNIMYYNIIQHKPNIISYDKKCAQTLGDV